MNKSTFVIGGLLIFFGLFFLLQSFNLIRTDLGDLISFLVPFGLIAFGVWLIVRKKAPKPKATIHFGQPDNTSGFTATVTVEHSEPAKPEPPVTPQAPEEPSKEGRSEEEPAADTSGKLRYSKTFGDMYVDCKGLNLSNVEVSMGVGDLEINLKEGALTKGLNRIIISGFIGDIRIFISKETAFFSHCSNFIGDINLCGQRASGFGNTVEHNTPGYDKAESKLYVAANNFIGDIKVYQM